MATETTNSINYIELDGQQFELNDAYARAKIEGLIEESQKGYGGTVYVETYDAEDLYTALTKAIADKNAYTVYDCTYFTGNITFPDTITITKPMTIKLGNCVITSSGKNFFDIRSNNVAIVGYNRATDRTDTTVDNSTVLQLGENSITQDCVTGFHIYSKGNKNLRFEYLTLKGAIKTGTDWTSLIDRQCGNDSYPVASSGGIYIEKENPYRTYGGNTCNNVIINQLLIDTTKNHGIYIDTAILSVISNTRLSHCVGHAIFLNSGTSIALNNVYVASANLAGFCISGASYTSLLNCVTEYSSIGFLCRAATNISLFSPGCESLNSAGSNPWSKSYSVLKTYGCNMTTTGTDTDGKEQIVQIKDVSSDFYQSFVGTPIVVSGGRSINIYSPYSTNLLEKGGQITSYTCLLRIFGNSRKVYVSNVFCNSSNAASSMTNDIRIEEQGGNAPSEVEIIYDVTSPTVQGSFSEYITNVSSKRAPVYVAPSAKNVLIHSGATFYTDFTVDGQMKAKSFSTDEINIDKQGITMATDEIIWESPKQMTIKNNSIGTNSGVDGTSTAYISFAEQVPYQAEGIYTIELPSKPEGYNTRLFIYDNSGSFVSYVKLSERLTQANLKSTLDTYLTEGQKFRMDFENSTITNVVFTYTVYRREYNENLSITPEGIITCKDINCETIEELKSTIEELKQQIADLSQNKINKTSLAFKTSDEIIAFE